MPNSIGSKIVGMAALKVINALTDNDTRVGAKLLTLASLKGVTNAADAEDVVAFLSEIGEELQAQADGSAVSRFADRTTFSVPEGQEAVRDTEGRATGELRSTSRHENWD